MEIKKALNEENKNALQSLPCGIIQMEKKNNTWTPDFVSDGFAAVLEADRETQQEYYYLDKVIEKILPADRPVFYSMLEKKENDVTQCRILTGKNRYLWFQVEMSFGAKDDSTETLRFVITNISKSTNHWDDVFEKTYFLQKVATYTNCTLFEYKVNIDTFFLSQDSPRFSERIIENFVKNLDESEFIQKDDKETRKIIRDYVQNTQKSITIQFKGQVKTGGEEWSEIRAEKLFSQDGTPEKIIGVILDINKAKLDELKIKEQQNYDELTQLYNLKAFNENSKKFFVDNSKPFSLLIFDIINFSEINEVLGFTFANEILATLADSIIHSIPEEGIAGRIGADIFAVLLPGTEDKEYIKKIVQAVSGSFFALIEDSTKSYNISLTCGISFFPKDGTGLEQLILSSSKALSKAKENGLLLKFFDSNKEGDIDEKEISSQLFSSLVASKHRDKNSLDTDIIEFSLDILAQTKDLSSAISLLLRKIGKYFDLSRVAVKEKLTEAFGLITTYEWCGNYITPTLKTPVFMSDKQWENLISKFDNDGLFISEPVPANTPKEELDRLISQRGSSSFIQCGFYDGTKLNGILSFEKGQFGYNWTPKEVQTIKTIAKILSVYLLKIRAYTNAQKMVDKLTNYDSITGLMRKELFKKNTINILKRNKSKARYGIIQMDFLNFKFLNETYGYEAGDIFLKEVGNYIKKQVYTVYASRFYSDNFVIFCSIAKDITDEQIHDSIEQSLNQFLEEQNSKYNLCNLSAVAGFAEIFYPDVPLEKTIDDAHSVRKMLKSEFTSGCKIFTKQISNELHMEAELINSVPKACKNGEFYFQLQPKVSLLTGKIEGAEALVRWKTQKGEIMQPGKFIPPLEKNGLITQIDFYLYRDVCRYIQTCFNNGYKVPVISLNVSRKHLANNDFIQQVLDLVSYYNIPPSILEFEITESVFLENSQQAINTFSGLRKQGFKVSIDDFGSGYSSLNMLKDLEIDVLKLDKAFLDDNNSTGKNEVIISSMINMAKQLKITALCEGVETQNQINFLKNAGCDLVQGFYFSKPLDTGDFTEKYNKDPFYSLP